MAGKHVYQISKVFWNPRSTDWYLAGNCWALEEGGRPGPLGDDGRGGQANRDLGNEISFWICRKGTFDCWWFDDQDLAARVEGRVQVVGIMVDVLSDLRAESEVSLSEIWFCQVVSWNAFSRVAKYSSDSSIISFWAEENSRGFCSLL